MLERPVFLQGLFPYIGAGLNNPCALASAVSYRVPGDKRAQLVYFRAGNPTDELVYALFHRDNQPLRYFPIGARAATHVELAVVEDLEPGTVLDVLVGAPEGQSASLVLDIGLVEIAA
ncbi:MAG: molybdopterin oxidoreductase [Bryobacteraceae bacterium]